LRYYGFKEFELARHFDPFHKIQRTIDSKFKHQVHIEDYWSDCKNNKKVRKRAHKRLTVEKIRTMGEIYVPLEVEDDDPLLHHSYESVRLAPIGEPDWTQPWNTSLDTLSKPMTLFSKPWLKDRIEELKAKGIEPTFPDKAKKRVREHQDEFQCFYEKKRRVIEAKIIENDKNASLMDPYALGLTVSISSGTFLEA